MYKQVEKRKENKCRAVANSVGQKKNKEKPSRSFVDNRPEALAQRKIISMMENGRSNPNSASDFACIQRAQIVQKPTVLGFHHWELQYGSSNVEEGLGPAGQIGAISATEDRDAEGSSGKLGKLAKGKAMVRVVDRHLSGYSKVVNGCLNPHIDGEHIIVGMER